MQDPRSKNTIPKAKSIDAYLTKYVSTVQSVMRTLPKADLERVFAIILAAAQRNGRIYVGGNGGSAAIGDHLTCDWNKGTALAGKSNLRVYSLNGSTALCTALANDFGYQHTLSFPVEIMGDPGDILILISSSGNSKNIVEAAKVAKRKGLTIIGFTGFKGGKLRDLADANLHISLENYGMVEDAHQMLMHVITQYLFKVRSEGAQ